MDIYKLKFTSLGVEMILFLSARAGETFSQRELAQHLNVSPTAVAKTIKQLGEYVTKDSTRTANLLSLNREYKPALRAKRTANLHFLYASGLAGYLEEQFAAGTIILFGSYAKGEDTHTSDIDIAVIGRKPKKLDLERFETQLFRKINIQCYDTLGEVHVHLRNNILNGVTLAGSVEV